MKELSYKDEKIYEKDRLVYKLKGRNSNYNVIHPSGKILSRFKIKNILSLRGKKQAIIGNLKIEKIKNEPISDAKIINREMKLIDNGESLSLVREDEFLGNLDFTNNTLEVYEDEGLCVVIFFALKKMD